MDIRENRSYSISPGTGMRAIYCINNWGGIVNMPTPNVIKNLNENIVGVWRQVFEGNEPGEVCRRGCCRGIIEERISVHSGCYCHISPPCGYCTEGRAYCPDCNWEAENA